MGEKQYRKHIHRGILHEISVTAFYLNGETIEIMKISKILVCLACLVWLAGLVAAAGQDEGRFHARFLLGFTGGATVSTGN